MLRFCFSLLAVISLFPSFSLAEFEWEPIPDEEFEIDRSPIDPEAGSDVIFKRIEVRQSLKFSYMKTEYLYYFRFRAYTEKGVEELLSRKLFYNGENELEDFSARTVKRDGTAVPLEDDMIYTEKIVKSGWRSTHAKTFAFPDLEAGDIVELRYRKTVGRRSPRLELSFMEEMPVREVSWKVWPSGRRSWSLRMMSFNYPDAKLEFDEEGALNFAAENLPAYREEELSPPWYTNQPAVIIYPTESHASEPDEFWKEKASDLADSSKAWLKPSGATRSKAKQLTKGVEGDWAQLRRMYDFCQKEIVNFSYPMGKLADGKADKLKLNEFRSDALKRGHGSMSDIVYLFGNMAKALGYDARIAALPDNRNLTFEPNMTLSFSHPDEVIAINLHGEWRFFDPSRPYLPMGYVPWWSSDSHAVIAESKGGGLQPTPKYSAEESVVYRTGDLAIDDFGNLEGSIRISYSGLSATDRRKDCIQITDKERKELFEWEIRELHDRAEIENLKVENLLDLDEPLLVSFDLRIDEYAPATGKRLFLKPAIFHNGENSFFQEENRLTDIHFPYPWVEVDEISVTFPEGFELEEGENPGSLNLGKLGEYRLAFRMSKTENKLYYERFFKWERDRFNVSEYPGLKQAFSIFNTRDSHMLTFSKSK